MAIEHLKVKIFSRAKGHSALAKAAYRSGEALHDQQCGITWNFTRKRHVDTTFILAPIGAPTWALSRETLWNRVEQTETRRNAQLARELEISLPRELTHAQQEALVRSFLREHFVSEGMVADCAIHRPPARTASESEPRTDNPHAHVMLTMRELTPDGFGRKRRDWNDVDLKSGTRRLWEVAANSALARAGRLERIDMRSFVDRGVDLVPQPPRGRAPEDVRFDGRSRVHEQHAQALRVARENGERILARPELVLELLSTRQSTFSEHDLLRALHRYTADADQFTRARLRVLASPELVVIPTDQGRPRYATRATVAAERSVLASANTLARRAGHPVRTGRIEAALETSARALSDEQAAAVRHLAISGDLALVEGYAGAGKSTMLAAARTAWTSEGYDVVGAALAGKAAEGLSDRSSAGIPSRTLAAWEWAWTRGRDTLTSRHVLVIDEAGMVGTRQLERVLRAARDAGAKVVLVGDTRQLQAIEPGAPMRLIASQFGASRLTLVIRQRDHAWQAAATKLFGDGRPKEALEAYVAAGRAHALPDTGSAQRALVARWARDRAASTADTTLLLAYRRADVAALNALARTVRQEAGELGQDHVVETARGVRHFAEGDRIYFLKNDKRLGVTNGTLATLEAIEGRTLRVRLDDRRAVTVDTTTYTDLDHGYAATIHKAQGVTVDRTYVLGSKYLDAAATYVALSRHRKDVDLFYSSAEFSSPEALVEKLARDRTQAMALEERAPRQAPATLVAREKTEQAFLALSPEAQLAELDRLKSAGERPLRSAAEVLELLPEVKAATAAHRDAQARVALAEQALADYRREHPLACELGIGRTRALEDALVRQQEARTAAETELARVRTSPERRRRAQRIATRHNLAVKHARERWTLYHDLRRRTERDAAVARYAEAANRQRGDRAFRAADRADEGKAFTVLLKREVRGEPVFVLRGKDGAFVIADARLFAREPALGTSAVLIGLNAESQNEPPTRGRRHGIDRSSDIDFD